MRIYVCVSPFDLARVDSGERDSPRASPESFAVNLGRTNR